MYYDIWSGRAAKNLQTSRVLFKLDGFAKKGTFHLSRLGSKPQRKLVSLLSMPVDRTSKRKLEPPVATRTAKLDKPYSCGSPRPSFSMPLDFTNF